MARSPSDDSQPLIQPRVSNQTAPTNHHSLEALAAEIHTLYFSGHPRLAIRWGHRIVRKRRRSIRLGSYNHRAPEIRIHPLLDSPLVPAYFIQSVIHHEYLHHILGARHSRRFHAQEQKFRYWRESKEWIRRNLGLLLGRKIRTRSPRTKPLATMLRKAVQLALW